LSCNKAKPSDGYDIATALVNPISGTICQIDTNPPYWQIVLISSKKPDKTFVHIDVESSQNEILIRKNNSWHQSALFDNIPVASYSRKPFSFAIKQDSRPPNQRPETLEMEIYWSSNVLSQDIRLNANKWDDLDPDIDLRP